MYVYYRIPTQNFKETSPTAQDRLVFRDCFLYHGLSYVVRYELFFISRNFAITSTGLLLPTAFCTAGSSTLMKTLCFWHKRSARTHRKPYDSTHLLIPNSKLPLRLLIVGRKLLQLLNRLILQHRNSKLDITLRILMPRIHPRIIR